MSSNEFDGGGMCRVHAIVHGDVPEAEIERRTNEFMKRVCKLSGLSEDRIAEHERHVFSLQPHEVEGITFSLLFTEFETIE